ncbi:MAG: undecaprenyl-phosphate glucose phosphotransferase [Caldilineaceae bacterium]
MATLNQVNFKTSEFTADDQAAPRTMLGQHLPHSTSRAVEFIKSIDAKWWKYILVASDVVLILLACILAYFVRYNLQWFRTVDPASEIAFAAYLPVALALAAICVVAYRLSNVYPYKRARGPLEQTYDIATATTASIMMVITISLFFRPLLNSRLIFLYIAIFITVLLGISRLVILLTLNKLRRYGVAVERTVLVGAGDVGRMVMRNIAARPELGYQLIGFLDDNPNKGHTDIGRFRALGEIDNLDALLETQNIQRVIICLPWQSHRTAQRLLRVCTQAGVFAQVVPDLFQLTRNQMQVEQLNGIPLISMSTATIQGWNLFLKRLTDITLTLSGAVLCLPLAILIAIAIRLDSPGPIIYIQTRIGRNGRPFRCFKFRSMVSEADQLRRHISDLNEASGPLFKMRDDPRLTRVGRFLRRYSLDELPQFINVLLGDMSLVGPRPNLPSEVDQYEEWHKKRLSASPGITGLWQVSGRSDLTFDEMVLLDIYYVENWSLLLDLSIILRSIPAVLRAKGAY